jgi:hypothetical protein
MPQKAGPYHNSQHRNDLEKIALTKDAMSPEDLGLVPSEETGDHPLTRPEDRRSDQSIQDKKEEMQDKQDEREQNKFDKRSEKQEQFAPQGRPEDGRPKNAKDQVKRKQKEVQPRQTVKSNFMNMMLWASKAQKIVANTVQPALLNHYDKKNLRSLTKQQADELEYIKLCILCNLRPCKEIDAEMINEILKSGAGVNKSIANTIESLKFGFVEENQRQPNIEERRQMCVTAYASFHTT